MLSADISRLAETETNARKRIKELIAKTADAMVIIGDKQQKINAMEEANASTKLSS